MKSRTRRRNSRKRKTVELNPDCNIDNKKCKKSASYLKPDIVNLAEKCNVNTLNDKGKVKTRDQLCDAINDAYGLSKGVEESKEDVLPINISILNVAPRYTEDILKKKTIPQLLVIAGELDIKKWNNKSIKNQRKPAIIEAIVAHLDKPIVELPTEIPIIPVELPSINMSEIPPVIPNVTKSVEAPVKISMNNIINVINQRRQQIIKDMQCNPYDNLFCNDDKVCDMTQKPNICVSKEEAEYKKKKGKDLELVSVGDKKILGKHTDIHELHIQPKATHYNVCKLCSYENENNSMNCIICNSNLSDEEIDKVLLPEGTEITEMDYEIPEGTEVIDLKDKSIEEILNEIQTSEAIKSVSGMDETRKRILYCLGLLD